jgi:2-hydroxy-3-oxopropionate reductase
MTNNLPIVGFIGLGEMGGPMACNLLRAGYPVVGYDLDEARLARVVAAGGSAGADVADVVWRSQVIATSLPSSGSFVQVAEEEILPNVSAGQIVIDFGTVTPPETRRLAARFAERGVDLLDAPVSGGGGGAERAQLYMFVGGREETVESCMPILHTIGGGDRLTYCGPAGSGQVVKGVNQLMMGLVDAAYLEAISFGVNNGVDIGVIKQAIGSEGRWRVDFNRTAQRIVDGQGNNVGVKFRELPYFLHAAQEAGFDLPITRTVREFCDKGPRIVIDDHREAPSYWHELTNRD